VRVWFIEIGEPLPVEEGKRLLRYGRFTDWLARRGHEVVWWACDFSHAEKTHVTLPGEHLLQSGVRLRVAHGPGYSHNMSLRRIWHHRAVSRRIGEQLDEAARRGQLPDAIICPIPTVENAAMIEKFAAKWRVPYMLDIRDEWPTELVRAAPRGLRSLARIALTLQFRSARRAAKHAFGILGVTQRQLEYGLALAGRAFNAGQDAVFYHGYTPVPCAPSGRAEANAWWRAQGLHPDAKVISFAGTLGVSFDFGPVFAAARTLHEKGRRDVQFVIAGDGDARQRLIEDAGPLAGKTVLFPGWIDQPRIDALLMLSTAALAPYIPATSMSLPNKFFEYMAYGLPVLSSCSGESEALVRGHELGIQYDPEDDMGFATALSRVIDDSAARAKMSKNARALFEGRFRDERLYEEMEKMIAAASGKLG